jgi:hypothetical protein
MRDLTPLTEDQIVEILKNQDKKRETPPKMSLENFLLDLYLIVKLGVAVCNTSQAAQILNLRVQREGIRKERPYDEYSVRQKVHAGVISKRTMEEELARPEGTAALYPLTEEEEVAMFGAILGNQHFFLVRDVLTVRITKHRHIKIVKEKGHRGRPRVRPVKTQDEEGKVGRPPTTYAGRIKVLTEKLIEYRREGDEEAANRTIDEIEKLHAEREKEKKKEKELVAE